MTINPDQPRVAYLLRIAAEFIRKYASHRSVHYDEADCDGACLADDLEIEASEHE